MARSVGPLDLIVVVGLVATVVGGSFLFIAADGTLQAPTSDARSVEEVVAPVTETDWLQPVLGEAIVEKSFLENQAARTIPVAAAALNQAVLTDQWVQQRARGHVASIKKSAQRLEAEHAGRVQAVMGRSIVNFTQRGVRNGLLSAALMSSAYNHRMISMTAAMEQRMDGEFAANQQPNLGRAIVVATRDMAIFAAHAQERMGHAIVQLTKTWAAHEDARSANQTQLGSLIMAAVRAELRSDNVALQAGRDSGAQQTAADTEPRVWPKVPFGYLVVGAMGLIGLFIAGLTLAPWRRDEEIVIEERMPGVLTRVYRKAV